jgi:nitrate/TMAO reductase-like tetraheme cytochrome c subunit
MKLLFPLFASAIFGWGFFQNSVSPSVVTILITGGAGGQLSPCGCTKPMSGGLKRLGTLIKSQRQKGATVWLETGGFVADSGRQSELKIETYAEAMGRLGVDVVAPRAVDQELTNGVVLSAQNLSKNKSGWLDKNTPLINRSGFNFKLVSADTVDELRINRPLENTILIVQGDRKLANRVAEVKNRGLIVFDSDGTGVADGRMVSSGSRLRALVLATFIDGKFARSFAVPISSDVPDDSDTTKVYNGYLRRVNEERLFDRLSRNSNAKYVGSQKCASCHASSAKVHFGSAHAKAMEPLRSEGHDQDPDCVSCHVTGSESTRGYLGKQTPALAQVGCESCHGAGGDHAKNPKQFHLKKSGENECLTCHTSTTSPKFNYREFWRKIRHK